MPAQEISITGSISNQLDNKPVPYAVVLLKGTKRSVTSDDNGNFSIKVDKMPFSLIVYQVGFFTKEILVTDQNTVKIELVSKVFNLNEVTVLSKKIDTLQQKNNSVFLAFEFYDNFIVALVNKGAEYNYIQFIDESGAIIKEKKAPQDVEQLFVDCFGNIQLIGKLYSYQLFYNYEEIIYLERVSINDFYLKIKPCQCSFGNYVYFKEVFHKRLKNRYFYVSRNKISDKKIILELCDKDKLERFNNDYDINYFLKERRKGAGYRMQVDELKDRLDELRESVVLSSDYVFMMPPVESELIKRDSFLLIIDYTNRSINRFSFLGTMLKKDTLKLNNLTPKAVVDADQNKFYFVAEEKGITSLYYLKEGDEYKKSVIEQFKFIKNLRSKNGSFYFLYRDPLNGSNMKIHVYKN